MPSSGEKILEMEQRRSRIIAIEREREGESRLKSGKKILKSPKF